MGSILLTGASVNLGKVRLMHFVVFLFTSGFIILIFCSQVADIKDIDEEEHSDPEYGELMERESAKAEFWYYIMF